MMRTISSKQTKNLAAKIAESIPSKGPVVFGLRGELGSGKTTFVQGFAGALGIKEKVLSPTFLIIKRFAIPQTERFLYHIDCYRVESSKELLRLGWKDIVQDKKNIVLVEWPERIKEILPRDIRMIEFLHEGQNKRTITIK